MRQCLQFQVSVLVMVVVALVSACGGNIQEKAIENSGAQHRLLIAVVEGQSSAFKAAVIQQLLEKYQATCTIEVINVSNIEQLAQKQYDVVLLIDRRQAGMKLNATFTELASKLDQKKLVAFITAGDAAWKYNENGIDAVTSASQKDKAPDVAQEIAQKIDGILHK